MYKHDTRGHLMAVDPPAAPGRLSLGRRLAVCLSLGLVLGLCLSNPLPAIAQVANTGSTGVSTTAVTGATGISGTAGFQCAPGTTWTNDGGVARCSIPAVAAAPQAACASQVGYTAGACAFNLPSAGPGVTISAPTTTPGWTGVLALTCNNGAWGSQSVSCVQIPVITVNGSSASMLVGDAMSVTWTSTAATAVAISCAGANPYSGSLTLNGTQTLPTANPGTTNCTLTASGPGGSGSGSISYIVNAPSNCAAATFTSGSCSFDFPVTGSGSTASGIQTVAGFTGSQSASCFNGVFTPGAATCAPQIADCSASTDTFGACAFSVPIITNGGAQVLSTTTPGYAGSLTETCNNGTLIQSGGSCVVAASTCPAQSFAYAACSFSLPLTSNGTTQSVASTTAGYVGWVSETCSNGSWVRNSSSCQAFRNLAFGACFSGVATYGACSFNLPNAIGTPILPTTTAGYTGTLNASCAANVWQITGGSCAPIVSPSPCAATPGTFGACAFSAPALSNGASQVLATTTAGYSGTLTAACSNGSVAFSGGSCSASASPCSTTSSTFGSCSFTVPGLASGSSQLLSTTTPGYSGSLTAACSNGTLNYSGGSCYATASPCAGTTDSYGFCHFTVPALLSGASQTLSTTTSGYTGSDTATCTNGTLSYSGQACSVSSGPVPSIDASTAYYYPDGVTWLGAGGGSGNSQSYVIGDCMPQGSPDPAGCHPMFKWSVTGALSVTVSCVPLGGYGPNGFTTVNLSGPAGQYSWFVTASGQENCTVTATNSFGTISAVFQMIYGS